MPKIMNSDEAIRYAVEHSNRIEQEPVEGRSFDNHLRAALLARTAAEVGQLLHPRVLHQLLYEGLRHPHGAEQLSPAGTYRPAGVNVYIVQDDGRKHMFPEGGLPVRALMEAWWRTAWQAQYYRQPDLHDPFVCWSAHASFESIHPFVDGNGRVGRLLWWNMEMLAGQTITVVAYKERFAYYERLEQWRSEHPDLKW